jgi:orotate phosphoribosyltransferase
MGFRLEIPIYCDNRKTLSFPEVRSFIRDSFAGLVKDLYPDAELDCRCGNGAIAHGALVADKLGLAFYICTFRCKGTWTRKPDRRLFETGARKLL